MHCCLPFNLNLRFVCLLLYACMAYLPTLHAQPGITLTQHSGRAGALLLTEQLQAWPEGGTRATAQQALGKTYQPLPMDAAKPQALLELTDGYWIKIPINNLDSVALQQVLTITSLHFSQFEAYVLRGGQLQDIGNSGHHLPQLRESISLPLALGPRETVTVLFHIKGRWVRATLQQQEAFVQAYEQQERPTQNLFYLFYGMCIIMLVYNLFLLLTTRDVSYLWYVLYLTGMTLFLWVQGNQSQHVLGRYFQFFTVYLGNTFIAIGFIAIVSFVRMYLHTPAEHKGVDKALLLCYGLNGMMLLVNAYGMWAGAIGAQLYTFLQQPVSLITIVSCLAAIVMSMVHGYRPALWMLLAFLPLVLAGFVFIFARMGLLEANTFTDNVVYFGNALEAALLSVALGGRINLTKAEKNRAERELRQRVQMQNEMLEEQVRKRTKEIEEKNVELEHQKEEILQQKEEIEAINENLADANRRVREHNSEMLASITYAQRIQANLLPQQKTMRADFADLLVLYKPKDILSGDFYWFAHQSNKTLLAVVDCTGHGVPGAFVSLLALNLLNAVVREQGLTDPALILKEMDARVRTILRQDDAKTETQDGMDMAICCLDLQTRTLQLASAGRPTLLYKDGDLMELPADKQSVGGMSAVEKRFTNQTYPYATGDRLYLFTDGITDQFDAENKKKYGSTRFRDWVAAQQANPLPTQLKTLENELQGWRGNTHQTDDILVLGVELK
jgi:serine phosphatase RsbU (regulator of sigma subunit)